LKSKPELEISVSNGDVGVRVICLVDTGCTKTLISNRLSNSINPQLSENKSIISTIHGETKSNMYILFLVFDNHPKSIRIETASHDDLKGYDAILGMDIINEGVLIIDKGEVSFNIDYLK